MKEPVRFVALRRTKYSDRYDILATYTREHGAVTFVVPAGKGREALRLRALVQPLMIVDGLMATTPGHDLARLSEAVASGGKMIHAHPVRSAVAQFIAETVTALLGQSSEDGDRRMFAFLEEWIWRLDKARGIELANFHIFFLTALTVPMGIEPDYGTYSRGYLLDLRDGVFRQTAPLHPFWLDGRSSRLVSVILRYGFKAASRVRLTRDDRVNMLNRILDYYSWHYKSLSGIKSLDVLKKLFD